MEIQILCEEYFGVCTYCIRENGHSVLIDPVATEELFMALGGETPDYVILTHEHFDHIRGVNTLRSDLGPIRVLCGEAAVRGLCDPAFNLSRFTGILKQYLPFGSGPAEEGDYTCSADETLKDRQVMEWEGHSFLVKETPGHSKGGISVLLDNQYLFAGDTVFKDYPTATRMPGGSTKAYRTTTEPWLDSLPQDVLVYPGHTEPFQLSERY